MRLELLARTQIDHSQRDTAGQRVDLSFDGLVIYWLPPNLRQEHLSYRPVPRAFEQQPSPDDCGALHWQTDIGVQIGRLQIGDVHAEGLRVLGVHRAELGAGLAEKDTNGG